MKLIIKEYLASLRERGELDAILPDLLSQMGLNVFISPSRGTKEYGVDIAATGSIDDGEEKVYLLSVKSGNLTRESWDGASAQSLRPSLNQIIDSFIPSRIPSEHKDKPIIICLCFGGDIHSGIRQEVSGYTNANTRGNISFGEWNGDKLADYIERYFMREDLAPDYLRSNLRKSLAMIDDPDVSFKHFNSLISSICKSETKNKIDKVTLLRQLLIYTWILYSWGRQAKNIESSYLASEQILLRGWDICKTLVGGNNKAAKDAFSVLHSILKLHLDISNYYIDTLVIPHSDNLYALSYSVSPSCPTDVNLKLFDLTGRIALSGAWTCWQCNQIDDNNEPLLHLLNQRLLVMNELLVKVVVNNPILFTPYKDDQAIDLVLAIFLLSLCSENVENIEGWLDRIVESTYINFRDNSQYPANIYSYAEIIEHPADNTEEYRKRVTKGSILYPYISLLSAKYGLRDVYDTVIKIKENFLSHTNFQVYFFDETSEERLYNNSEPHGATLSHVSLDKEMHVFAAEIEKECKHTDHFNQLSAMKYGFWPIILLACRHYRLPVPMHFLIDMSKPKDSE